MSWVIMLGKSTRYMLLHALYLPRYRVVFLIQLAPLWRKLHSLRV